MTPSPDAPPAAAGRNLLRWAASWGATVVVFAIVALEVPLGATLRTLADGDFVLLAAGVVVALAGQFLLAAMKYREMLRLLGMPLDLGTILTMRVGTLSAARFLPLMACDAMRVAYLRRVHRLPVVRGVSLTLLETAWDVSMLATFAAVGAGSPWSWAVAAAWLAGVAAVGLSGAPRGPVHGRIATALARVREWSAAPRTRRIMARVGALSFVIVACDVAATVLAFRAVHLDAPAVDLARRVPWLLIAAAIPLTPMGLGTREAAAVLILAPFGTLEQRVAGALAASMVSKVIPALLGLPWVRPVMARLASGPEDGRGEPPPDDATTLPRPADGMGGMT